MINNDKIPSFSLTSCSEQRTYYMRSALSDQLEIEPFRTNLRRFCPSISGKYFWNNIPLSIRPPSLPQSDWACDVLEAAWLPQRKTNGVAGPRAPIVTPTVFLLIGS